MFPEVPPRHSSLSLDHVNARLRSNSSSPAPSGAPHCMGGQGRIAARSPPRANLSLPLRWSLKRDPSQCSSGAL